MSSFQPLLPDSKLMKSCHVMWHVTTVMCLLIVQEIKEKEKKRKREIVIRQKYGQTLVGLGLRYRQ